MEEAEEFMVHLERDSAKLGIAMAPKEAYLLVGSIAEAGLVSQWNASHPMSQQVRPGDRVISVNGISATTQAMLKQCQVERSLRLLIQRGSSLVCPSWPQPPSLHSQPSNHLSQLSSHSHHSDKATQPSSHSQLSDLVTQATVDTCVAVIERCAGEKLGISLARAGDSLLVGEIAPHGLVRSWNDRHPGAAAEPGDRITRVGGRGQGDSSLLLELLQKPGVLQITLQRRRAAAGSSDKQVYTYVPVSAKSEAFHSASSVADRADDRAAGALIFACASAVFSLTSVVYLLLGMTFSAVNLHLMEKTLLCVSSLCSAALSGDELIGRGSVVIWRRSSRGLFSLSMGILLCLSGTLRGMSSKWMAVLAGVGGGYSIVGLLMLIFGVRQSLLLDTARIHLREGCTGTSGPAGFVDHLFTRYAKALPDLGLMPAEFASLLHDTTGMRLCQSEMLHIISALCSVDESTARFSKSDFHRWLRGGLVFL